MQTRQTGQTEKQSVASVMVILLRNRPQYPRVVTFKVLRNFLTLKDEDVSG